MRACTDSKSYEGIVRLSRCSHMVKLKEVKTMNRSIETIGGAEKTLRMCE
jgi:hypothetical protein